MTNLNIELQKEFLWDLDGGYENYTHKIMVDGKKIGSAEIIYKEDEDEQYVENIFVDKDYRGQGIATEVLNRLAEEYNFIYFAAADEYSQGLYEHIAEEYNGKNIEVGQGYGVFFIEA